MSFYDASNYQEYEKAIDCGNDVNEEDIDGCTPLFSVSVLDVNDYFIEYDKIVDLLLEHGADIDHQDDTGYNALMKSNCDIFSLVLLKKGAKIDLYDDSGSPISALVECSIKGQEKSIEFIIKEMGVDINKSINGDTVLTKVLNYMDEHRPWYYWCNTVKKLIQLGACVNTLDSRGLSPLFYGINNYRCAHMLVNAGADVNFSFTMRGISGMTLLHLVCARNCIIVELLLENGANVNAVTSDGNTPLLYLLNRCDSYDYDTNMPSNFFQFMKFGATCSNVNKYGISAMNSLYLREEFKSSILNRLKDERWSKRGWIICHRERKKQEFERNNAFRSLTEVPDDVFKNIIKFI